MPTCTPAAVKPAPPCLSDAVEVALCFGWIDGQGKKHDDVSRVQRFTPRRTRSGWSKINTERAERLIQAGKMRPAGQREVDAARADGRWAQAYDPPSQASVPEDFLRELRKNKKAAAFFSTLNKRNTYPVAYRLQTAKTPETRARRMRAIIRAQPPRHAGPRHLENTLICSHGNRSRRSVHPASSQAMTSQRPRRDEAGQALAPWLLLIAVLAALPILIPAVQDVHDIVTGKWNAKEQALRAPTADDIPFIGPGLPTDKTKADCVEREAARVGLYWTAKGWRTTDIEEPGLNGDPARVRAEIHTFERRMNTYVGSRTKEWANCLTDLPDQPVEETPTTGLKDFSGTYTLDFQGGNCASPPTYVTVNQTARTVVISLNGKLALGGTLNGDNTFDASHSEPVDFNLPGSQTKYTGTFRLHGRFDQFGDQVLIREGLYEVTIDTTCTSSFTGRRQ